MRNRIPLLITFIFGVVIVPLIVFGANDVSFSDGTVSIQLPNGDTFTVASGDTVRSFTANDNNTIAVVVEEDASFVLTSGDRRAFTYKGVAGCNISADCNTDSSTLSISCADASGTQTITITPSGTCSTDQTSGGGGAAPAAPSSSGSSPTTDTETESVSDPNVASVTVPLGTPSSFSVGGGATHTVTINSADATSASITIESKPINLNLTINNPKNIDTDSNGQYDLRVTYLGLDASSGYPNVQFDAIAVCTLSEQQPYSTIDSNAVYYVTTDCSTRAFRSANKYFTYFTSWSDVNTVSSASLSALNSDALGFMPWGPLYDPKYGALVKTVTDPKVYLLLGSERYWITDETVFEALYYASGWGWIEDIDQRLLDNYSEGSEINYTDRHPNYTVVKYNGDAKVYRLEPDPADSTVQVKRWIPSENIFNQLTFRWDRIVTVDDSEVYPDGADLTKL